MLGQQGPTRIEADTCSHTLVQINRSLTNVKGWNNIYIYSDTVARL